MNGALTPKTYEPADLIVRPAHYTDAEAIARLITQLGYPTAEQEILLRLKELFARSDDHLTAVANLHGHVIGVIAAAFGFHIEHTGAYGRVNALSVEQDHRNRRIGARLLAYAEAWLREKGANICIVNSRLSRGDAHRFYESNGYSKTGYRLAKEI